MSTHSRRIPRSNPRPRRFPSPLLAGIGIVTVAGLLAVTVLLLRGGNDAQPAPIPAAGAAGVLALQPSVNLGRVPLNTPVQHAFRLKNTGDAPVTLGQARVETLEGC